MSLLIFVLFSVFSLSAQVDEYQEYMDAMKKQQSEYEEKSKKDASKLEKEYSDYLEKANAEFAEFMAKEWALFEEFKVQELSMMHPKIKEAPVADKSKLTDIISDELQFNDVQNLPQISDVANVNAGDAVNYTPRTDNYVVRKVVTDSGVKDVVVIDDFSSFIKNNFINIINKTSL